MGHREAYDRASRRRFLLGLASGVVGAAGPRAARADGGTTTNAFDPEADLRNLKVIDATEGGRRFVLLTPRWQNPDSPVPLVVFLHGLGETSDPRLGAYAWLERYGLGSAWQRLKRAPIERTSKRGEWTDARLDEVNAELAARPFRGFAMACPYMPKPRGAADHDAYAEWIERSLLPRCRAEARVLADPARTYLCGVSLGGYVSLEVLVRLPHVFGGWAGLQTAIGTWAAPRYAEKSALARQADARPHARAHSCVERTARRRARREEDREHLPRRAGTARSAMAARGRDDRGAPLARPADGADDLTRGRGAGPAE